MYNVLVFPGGSENGLELLDSLKYHIDVNVFGGSSRKDFGSLAYKNYFDDIPNISQPDFILKFNELIVKNEIEYVFPTHDSVALFLARHSEQIPARIINGDERTNAICRSKAEIYKLFKNAKYCPIVYEYLQIRDTDYPVFVKPDLGQGGQNCILVSSSDQLQLALNQVLSPVICEYLPGPELTVDCFTDRLGRLKFVGPRSRERITMGISFRSSRIPCSIEILEIAKDINTKLKFQGLWFFQLKKSYSNTYKLLEVSTRCAGSMGLYRHLGINFALLSLFDASGKEVEITFNDNDIFLERRLQSFYGIQLDFEEVFIDYDDTFYNKGKVNPHVVAFVYKCINLGKRIILITKHPGDLDASLRKFRINPRLFDSVLHLDPTKRKVDFIHNKKAIFIDNSFAERKCVKEVVGIPVFDVDALEFIHFYNE